MFCGHGGGHLKSSLQCPKSEEQSACGTRPPATAAAGTPTGYTKFLFGFRISAFFRPSDFGLRISTPALWLLIPALPLLAATPTSPDAIPPLRPPYAEMPPTFWDQYSLWVILFGVLLLALVCAVAWVLTRPKQPMVVPPEVQARQALEPLRQQPEEGVLLSRVSQILRHYVAAAFDLPPGELTTTEFCGAIAGHAPIGPELSAALNEFLRECDQRKFSPPTPVPPFSAVARALELIDLAQTRRLALAQSLPQ